MNLLINKKSKLEVGHISEGKGKDANITKIADKTSENGTMSDLLCLYLYRNIETFGTNFLGSNGKLNTLGICGVREVPE
ncbi:hypothetical protein F8M41_017994 [Gigaspora margarita]|uniref:Uncharacterized protein n=1 Tax=Gigaspora margarita TaxID=4874 RepID=A0A8H3WTT3_GIGMA|nr:hypothetical protein F8M41_017994 [Gigaspora margarita]